MNRTDRNDHGVRSDHANRNDRSERAERSDRSDVAESDRVSSRHAHHQRSPCLCRVIYPIISEVGVCFLSLIFI